MKIFKTGDEQFKVVVSPAEGHIFVNCFNETEKALGDWEFPTRMGGEIDEVKALFSAIEAALR